MAKPIEVGDKIVWTDRGGLRCTGRVSEIEREKFSEVTLLVNIDDSEDMGVVLLAHEVQLESAVDRLGRLT